MNAPAPRISKAAIEVGRSIRTTMALLFEAFAYAEDVGHSRWDFAVEILRLRGVGVTNSDLRWLITKGYAEHAEEITSAGEDGRSFRPSGSLALSDKSCFVPTDEGIEFAQRIGSAPALSFLSESEHAAPSEESGSAENAHRSSHGGNGSAHRGNGAARNGNGSAKNGHANPAEVVWDSSRRELCVAGEVVKRYRVPAANQELILGAFQEEGWPARIDDPLPPVAGIDPKQRLHAAINCLNRNRKSGLIRFRGDGNGNGICWEIVVDGKTLRKD